MNDGLTCDICNSEEVVYRDSHIFMCHKCFMAEKDKPHEMVVDGNIIFVDKFRRDTWYLKSKQITYLRL